MFLTAAAIVMFFYGFYELISWAKWLRHERGEPEEIPEEKIITDLRKIHTKDYTYTSPIESEDYEKDSFEWGVKRFRVEGERLIEDVNFGRNADYNEE